MFGVITNEKIWLSHETDGNENIQMWTFLQHPPSQIEYIKNIIFITLNCIFNGFVLRNFNGRKKNPVTIFCRINHAYYNTLKFLKYHTIQHLSHPLPKHSLVCDVSPKIKQ